MTNRADIRGMRSRIAAFKNRSNDERGLSSIIELIIVQS